MWLIIALNVAAARSWLSISEANLPKWRETVFLETRHEAEHRTERQ
jgi:hypothetical protein